MGGAGSTGAGMACRRVWHGDGTGTMASMASGPAHPAPSPAVTQLQRNLPNWLTSARVMMAIVFFVVLTYWRWEGSAAERLSKGFSGSPDWWLLLAAVLFIIACLTDVADGYLARKWHVESAFGRIMDPFADKILVVGAYIFLAGPDFWWEFPADAPARITGHGIQISGIYPWMVVVILARELLVTSIRAVLEGQGIKFPADISGKVKMILQSIAIPTALVATAVTNVLPHPEAGAHWWINPWGRILIDVIAWAMMFFTVASGVPYIVRAGRLLAEHRRNDEVRAAKRAQKRFKQRRPARN